MGEEPHCHQGCQTPRHKYSQLAHFCVRFRKGFQDTKNAFFRILVKLGFLRDDPAQLFTFLCDFHEITGEKVGFRMLLEFSRGDWRRVGPSSAFKGFQESTNVSFRILGQHSSHAGYSLPTTKYKIVIKLRKQLLHSCFLLTLSLTVCGVSLHLYFGCVAVA